MVCAESREAAAEAFRNELRTDCQRQVEFFQADYEKNKWPKGDEYRLRMRSFCSTRDRGLELVDKAMAGLPPYEGASSNAQIDELDPGVCIMSEIC